MTCLHLYETFGDRGRAEHLRHHYAEADNELHHLLIMEALGGADKFADRFIAQHLAFGYYWYCVLVYMLHPRAAYHLTELVEDHAYRTYDAYLARNADALRAAPVPQVARDYYGGRDALKAYLLDGDDGCDVPGAAPAAECATREASRPLESLYDVFVEIREDEAMHWRSMVTLGQYDSLHAPEGCAVETSDAADKK
jgi:ubiquinol oxidase